MVLYSYSDTTVTSLIQSQGFMKTFRKAAHYCPSCDHHQEDWFTPDVLVEVGLWIDMANGPAFNPVEEYGVLVSECPKCGAKSAYHYPLRTMLYIEHLDHEKIQAEMDKRGLVDGHVAKETSMDAMEARVTERVMRTQMQLGIDPSMFKTGEIPTEIPDFEIPCGGESLILDDDGHFTGIKEPCTVVWTKENTSPRWMTPTILITRCPNCGHQRQIQDEVKK